MSLKNIISLNFKKLKAKPRKAMFLIVPVTVLVALSVIVSSQIENIRSAMDHAVLDTMANQYTLLRLVKEKEESGPGGFFREQSSFEKNRFTNTDVANIESMDGVSAASLEEVLPINNTYTQDLFDGKSIELDNISSLIASGAGLYTEESFEYSAEEAIPIILNASSFKYNYQDWSEGNTITVDMTVPERGEQQEPPSRRTTVEKSESISYEKEDLIGKNITINFGSLDEIANFTTTFDRETRQVTIAKLTDEEYQAKVDERKTAISQYWDYDKISTPISYKFTVVGIIEDEGNTQNYVPSEFMDVLMHDLINREMNARTETIPTDVLNADFLGMTYNGDELTNNLNSVFGQVGNRFGGERMREPGSTGTPEEVNFLAYNIPGLVINVDDSNTVTGTLDDADIYSKTTKYGDSLNIVLNDITDRDDIVKALNKAGYAYQDMNDLEVVEKLASTLNKISEGFMLTFIVLLVSIIILTMSRFVAESTREIGIYRAIGMRKTAVLAMFLVQAVLCIFIAYVIGGVVGLVSNYLVGNIVSVWFNSFVKETISQTVAVTTSIDESLFYKINWLKIGIYTIILVVSSFLASIMPAIFASKISPVEAIKNE